MIRTVVTTAALTSATWVALTLPAQAQVARAEGERPAVAQAAHEAQAQSDEWDGGFDLPPAERRSDVVVGLTGGLVLGSASGFPNEADKIGQAEFESNTGFALGSGGTLFIGAALADTFTIGLGVGGGSISSEGLKANGGAFLFRVEGFPLYSLGHAWRDVGLFADFGAGGMTITRDGEDLADGGAMSSLSFGAFYEGVRFWQVAQGPFAEYHHMFSQSLVSHRTLLGWRVVVYTGP